LAFNMVIAPVAKIKPIVTKVALPIFARIQADVDRLKRGYIMVLKGLSIINFPLLIGLVVTAPVFIRVVFGAQWLPSVILVQILAFVALVRSTGNPVGALLLSKGRADLGFRWNAAILFSQGFGVFIGAKIGSAEGVALSLLSLQILYFVPNYVMNVRSLVGACWREYIMSMVPALLVSVAMALPVWSISMYQSKASFTMLAIQIGLGASLYLAVSLRFQRSSLRELRFLIFDRRPSNA
jgi:lipopolysaccharide exporter